MPYLGTIIEESLENKDVLGRVKIISTKVEPIVEKHKTPWLKQWTLHKVEISESEAENIAEEISRTLESEHSWYADFKNETTHYIIFKNKIFKINRTSKEQYDMAKEYGLSLGIPPYQVDFHPEVKEWKRESLRSNNLLIFLLIILAAALGGGAGVFGKIALAEIPPFSFTFLRFLIAAIFLIPFSLKYLPTFQKKDYKIILLSLLASANVVLFAFGIKHTTANISQMIYTAVPIVSALLSFYYLKEKFGARKIIGIIVGFIGTILVVLLPLLSRNNGGSTIGGNLIIVLAMLLISAYWVFSKKFHEQYSSLEINNYFIFTTTILLFFLSIFDLFRQPDWYGKVSLNAYLALTFVAILSTAIYYLISQIIVKKATPVMASMVLYVQPFATFIWAYYFLAEKLSLLFLAGVLLSLLGVGIYNFSIRK